MQKYRRPVLHSKLSDYLAKKQDDVDRTDRRLSIQEEWKRACSTKSMRRIRRTLSLAAGPDERCMYCHDSQAVTIEHYYPKSKYEDRAFDWNNFLAICSSCNVMKGDELLLGDDGQGMMINPLDVDPWEYIEYSVETDHYTARWWTAEEEDPKGRETLDVLSKRLEHQAVMTRRRKVRVRLQGYVSSFLRDENAQAGSGNIQSLIDQIVEDDTFGLCDWFFFHEGSEAQPFCSLKLRHGHVWAKVIAAIKSSRRDYGITPTEQILLQV
ncbi:MAG: HNH endonuclease [Myxococcota bacterium]